jgi:hypothetical protein
MTYDQGLLIWAAMGVLCIFLAVLSWWVYMLHGRVALCIETLNDILSMSEVISNDSPASDRGGSVNDSIADHGGYATFADWSSHQGRDTDTARGLAGTDHHCNRVYCDPGSLRAHDIAWKDALGGKHCSRCSEPYYTIQTGVAAGDKIERVIDG